MEKIVIVVRDGFVENIFVDTPEKVKVEIVDFDGATTCQEVQEYSDYVKACQQTMYEV